MDVGSCMSTFVSSTNSRRPSRGRPGSERLRCFKYFLRVARNFHLAPLAPQDASVIQQKRAALDAQVLLTVETLLLDDIEQLAGFFFCVGKEGEREVLLLHELVVRLHAVARDTDNVHACFTERTV